MNFGKFSVNNRYIVFAIVIAVVLFGIYSRFDMQEQLSPDTSPPTATVMAGYPGASVQDVADDVVEPIEDEFGRIDGVTNISSTNQDNLAMVEVQFSYDKDIGEGTIDIQNAINRIREELPEAMEEPTIMEFGASQQPVMTVSLSSDSLSLQDLRNLAEEEISYEMQLLDGIAAVDLFGGYNQEVQVNVDRDRLKSHNLSLERIAGTLAEYNIQAPGGEIEEQGKKLLVRFDDSFYSLAEIEEIQIPIGDGGYVHLKDLAQIELADEDRESSYRFNQNTAIAMMITKTDDANTVDVVENVNNRIAELENEYPHLNFAVAQDDSDFIVQMVDNMTESVLLAIVFTVITITLFISKINQSLVVAISMPLVFLTTLSLMNLFDMKFDMVTMSALILSIGWVIDATVVVVENIMTHYQDLNKNIIEAAIDGTKEITAPLFSGTGTTLIVLVPLLFIEGFVGEMFGPLAMTLIFAISSSIFVAITIIPLFTVIFSKLEFARLEKYFQYVSVPFNNVMDRLMNFYVKILERALANKGKVFVVAILLFVVSARLLIATGIEMLPKFDSGVIYVSLEREAGTTIDDMENTVEEVENYIASIDNVESYDAQLGYEAGTMQSGDFGVMDTNQAFMSVNLNSRHEREETIWEIQDEIRSFLDKLPNVDRYVVREEGGTPATGTSMAPIDVKISGPDQEILYHFANKIKAEVKDVEGATNLYTSFTMDDRQIMVRTNKNRAQDFGLTSAEISTQVFGALNGIEATNMDVQEFEDLDISVRYQETFRDNIQNLEEIYLQTPTGDFVQLGEVASVEVEERANLITTEDNQYTVSILGYNQDRAFSHVAQDINSILADYSLPQGYEAVLAGESQDILDSIEDMAFLMIIALLLIYLLLVSQFSSFIYPISIMSVIPFVVIGIMPALRITGKFISMPVLLAIILLAGTIINNSILLIHNILNNQKEGQNIVEASVNATKNRFRPIMMTAISDVVGMLPLALQLALGSERFSPLAIAVIGGVISATFLTMIVVPVVFASLEKATKKVQSQLSKISVVKDSNV